MKARPKGNDVITNVISANQHFASIFSIQIFKFQRRSCKLPFLSPSRHQNAPESLLTGYHDPRFTHSIMNGELQQRKAVKARRKPVTKAKSFRSNHATATRTSKNNRSNKQKTNFHVHNNFLYISLPFLHD